MQNFKDIKTVMTRMEISHTQHLWYENRHTHYHCKNVTGNVYAIFCVFYVANPTNHLYAWGKYSDHASSL